MIRTFIYGSCVSRDTFEFLDPNEFTLLRYVARSSLVSACSPPGPDPLPAEHNLSPFQLRQVHTDTASALPPLLRDLAGKIDLLLWDLVDERLGFFEDGEGHVVTDSVELRKAGIQGVLARFQHFAFGTSPHLERFRSTLPRWREFLDDARLINRVAVLAPPWAETDVNGEDAPPSFGMTGAEGNRLLKPYYDAVSELVGVPLLGRGIQTHTDQAHKWGPAPFHYSATAYHSLVVELERWTKVGPPRA
ncbi:DUF6270 domain-containing protein [Intrasporangium sp. DVR]|uniref:DUF6270 domain-containing protein n=1 Tax=Intrasporangium sp. DVR TaxID=3127867 RepID=UPI00313A6425